MTTDWEILVKLLSRKYWVAKGFKGFKATLAIILVCGVLYLLLAKAIEIWPFKPYRTVPVHNEFHHNDIDEININ